MSQIAPLCELCAAVFNLKNPALCFTSNDNTISLEWHPNINTFRSSAKSGCRLCIELWQDALAVNEEWSRECISEHLLRFVVFLRARAPFKHKALDSTYKFLIEFASISMEDHKDTRASNIFGQHWVQQTDENYGSQLASVTKRSLGTCSFQRSSLQNLSTANTWLTRCLREHESCRATSSDPALPLRLIHLREQSSGLRARLAERDDIPRGCQYLTLSHCWGSGPVYSLRSGLLASFREDIPIAQLPRTFQDAFHITYNLGYCYLWIDSLTILQDVANDWAQEAARMADIYENAICNLAATGFKSSDTGLFATTSTTSPELTISVNIQLPGLSVQGNCSLIQTSYWDTRITKAPLNRRAWVLQERFFSPRVLHFSRDQLLWECQQLQACELAPCGIPPPIQTSRATGYKSYREIMDLESGPRLNVIRTTCDRLVAISGIIKRFEKILDDLCVAGLWQKTFVTDLLWCRAWLDHRELPRTSEFRAPTWSWASLDCSIYCNVSSTASRLVADVRIPSNSSKWSGQAGALRIRAPLLKGQCRPVEHGQAGLHFLKFTLRDRTITARVKFDGRPEDIEGDDAVLRTEEHTTRASTTLQPGTIWVYMLVVVSKASTAGLLLKRLDRTGLYSRLGYFDTYIDPKNREIDDLENLDECLKNGYTISPDGYIDNHGGGMYTLTII